jgi:hypothetical protein
VISGLRPAKILYDSHGDIRPEYAAWFNEDFTLKTALTDDQKAILSATMVQNITAISNFVFTYDSNGKLIIDKEFITALNEYIAAYNEDIASYDADDKSSLIGFQNKLGQFVTSISTGHISGDDINLLSFFLYDTKGSLLVDTDEIASFKEMTFSNLIKQTVAIQQHAGTMIQRYDAVVEDAKAKLAQNADVRTVEIVERDDSYQVISDNLLPDWVKAQVSGMTTPAHYFIKAVEVIDGVYYQSLYTENGELISKVVVTAKENSEGKTVYTKTIYKGNENNNEI